MFTQELGGRPIASLLVTHLLLHIFFDLLLAQDTTLRISITHNSALSAREGFTTAQVDSVRYGQSLDIDCARAVRLSRTDPFSRQPLRRAVGGYFADDCDIIILLFGPCSTGLEAPVSL